MVQEGRSSAAPEHAGTSEQGRRLVESLDGFCKEKRFISPIISHFFFFFSFLLCITCNKCVASSRAGIDTAVFLSWLHPLYYSRNEQSRSANFSTWLLDPG